MTKISYVLAVVLYPNVFAVGLILTKIVSEMSWLVALVVIFCHIILSLVIINEKQLGAMFIFGQAIDDLESGLHFAFWPVCYIRRETKNIVQLEIGVLTEEEKKKAAALESSASVFLLEDPFYVNWGDINSAEGVTDEEKKKFKGNPYADAMVTATHVTVRFRIHRLTRLIKKAGSLTEAIELIQKVVTSTLVSHAGKSFVGRVIGNMEKMDDSLRKAVEEFVVDPHSNAYTVGIGGRPPNPDDSWGIDVERTQITRLGTAKRISEAQADKGKVIYAAQGERIRLQEVGAGVAKAIEQKAEADQIRLTKEGFGTAEAEKLLLLARQVGTAKLAEVAKTPEGLLVLQLQALENGLRAGKVVILPMELSKIVGALSDKLLSPSRH